MVVWIHIEMTDFIILFISKRKQYKNANVVNFVYYGKTRMWPLCAQVNCNYKSRRDLKFALLNIG